MRKTIATVVAGIGLGVLVTGAAVQAHHAFAAEFDADKPVRLRGTITKMEWINPHSWIHICLLYTSPSPRDRSVSRMPSSA